MLDLSGDTVMIFGATKPKMAETLAIVRSVAVAVEPSRVRGLESDS